MMMKHGQMHTIPYPYCIMTDSDAAIKAAIKTVWPQSSHLLCLWHIISKNASDNLKKTIGLNNSAFNFNLIQLLNTY